MQTRRLGTTDIELTAIGLGGMPLSIAGRPDEESAIAVIHAALNAGVRFIDTADAYCLDDDDIGHNERLIAKGLASRSEKVLVATKGGLQRPEGNWTTNGRPEHLRRACDRSLKALGVETIDLYQLHARDDDVPYADSVGALAELQTKGKVRHLGLSNVTVDEIEEARAIAPIVSVQNRLNLFDTKSIENGVLKHCDDNDITFLPYSPVGGHRRHDRVAGNAELAAIAQELGCSSYELALAYLLTLCPCIVPIPGASKVRSIESSAGAADISLTDDVLAKLRAAFPRAVL